MEKHKILGENIDTDITAMIYSICLMDGWIDRYLKLEDKGINKLMN